MSTSSSFVIRGLWCAMLTPLASDGSVDHRGLVAHARRLLDAGVAGVAPFGTTGEGQSFSMAERRAGLDALLAGGIPAQRIVAATGCAALPETIELSRHALNSGCATCLVLPPFFWKGVDDAGLFDWYAGLIDGVDDPRFSVLLYNLPQVSSVPISVELVARLTAAFPGTIAGVKDSEGNWAHTAALLARVPQLAILVGHEPHLPRLMRAGGAGTVCGVANLYPAMVQALLQHDVSAESEARMGQFLDIAFRQPLIPALKAMLADQTGESGWLRVRPPLVALDDKQRRLLRSALAEFARPQEQAQQ